MDISKGYGSLGRLGDAFRAGAEGVRTALLSGVPVTISYALSSQSQHLHLLHRDAEALELADSALGVSRRNNLLQTTSMALLARSNALRSLSRPQEALAALEEAYKIDLKRKDRHRVVLSAMLQANLLFEQKKFLPCLDLLEVATSEARAATGQPVSGASLTKG